MTMVDKKDKRKSMEPGFYRPGDTVECKAPALRKIYGTGVVIKEIPVLSIDTGEELYHSVSVFWYKTGQKIPMRKKDIKKIPSIERIT